MEENLMRKVYVIEGAGLIAHIDAELGVICSLKEKEGQLDTDYAGNPDNVSYPSFLSTPLWLGDLQIRSWNGSGWIKATTASSSDIRKVQYDQAKQIVKVLYEGQSKNEHGLQNVDITISFFIENHALQWEIGLTNRDGQPMEIGELSLAFTTNTDFSGLFAEQANETEPNWRETRQMEWHERRVMQHLHVSGHNSYALLQRPRGDFPCLFFQPVGDAALEAAYQIDPTIGSQWSLTFEGPYFLSLFTTAARQEGKWLQNRERQSYWFNGHSSLILAPGESRTFRFRFALLNEYAQVAEQLYEQGQVAVEVQPGMVAPSEQEFLLALRSKTKPSLIPEANHIGIEELGCQDDKYRYKIRFGSVGQKKIRVVYGDGEKYTNLLFYSLPPIDKLLKARADTIVERHFYDNASDPYSRHHAFLPYDDKLESLFLEGEESWQVGGADEYGLPIAMFLAEKNVYYPNEKEIATLETYIDDYLFQVLQNRETYEIIRGCFWEEAYPSRFAHQWDIEASGHTWRTFNYPLVANIYHAMYRIGKLHGLTKKRSTSEYLSMAWRTALLGYEYGEWKSMGAPAGFHGIQLLQDVELEDSDAFVRLNGNMRRFAEDNNNDPYPYGSELYTDQTAHHQVYTFMKHYGFEDQAQKTLQVTKALRAGAQPVWYRYGNEQRGNVCCWYATALNSNVMLEGYEETGDEELLKWGFAGMTSFLTTVRPTGVAHGWFTWWPDRAGFDQRSLDTDMGLFGYLEAARAYVVKDDTFGLVGYGCRVSEIERGMLRVIPLDGIRKRLFLREVGIVITVTKGELEQIEYSPSGESIRIKAADTTGLVGEVSLIVKGFGAKAVRLMVKGKETIVRLNNKQLLIEGVPLEPTGTWLEIEALPVDGSE
jgi:hypothetical protein